MLNGMEMETSQMSGLNMVTVDEHESYKKATAHTMVGKNLFVSGVLRPGSQPLVSPLSLRYSLQDSYKIRTERGHYSITPTTFMVLNEGRLIFEGSQAEIETSGDPYISKFVKARG